MAEERTSGTVAQPEAVQGRSTVGASEELTEAEALSFFAEIYLGKHHIPSELRRDGRLTWSVCHWLGGAGLSTFDYDELTRMVFLAHDRCVRLAIVPSGPKRVRIQITKRSRGRSHIAADHPTLEEAVEKWRTAPGQAWTRRWANPVGSP